ncbi:MAG: serine hydrolase domain-containing protein [Acidimicrobiia bacterium]|nr:serine hydrolase domain-containing protein [Acidimicrobiia bacterium]
MSHREHFSGWPVKRAGYAVLRGGAVVEQVGDEGEFELASISKLFAALTAMVAYEEGSLDLDDPAGPEGSTVRHLLAHAAGYDFDRDRTIAAAGARRVYSNVGIEKFAEYLAGQTGMSYEEYLRLGVLDPLGMSDTVLHGSPAHGMRSTVADVARLAAEFLRPTLVSPDTMGMATRPVFPDLGGVLPGVGRFDPNPFGLGIEVKGDKSPHWSGSETSPQTFGHFGGAGTFLWVDPVIDIGAVALTDRDFDLWAMRSWPEWSDLLIDHLLRGSSA